MKRMIANKSFTYNTRRLMAGDVFEAKDKDARILAAINRAKPQPPREPVAVPAPPAPVKPDMDDLRAKAAALGIKVDARWGVPRLTAEINSVES